MIDLISRLRKNQPICQLTKKLGISHLMLRRNLADYSWFEDPPEKMLSILQKHPDIQSSKSYHEGGRPLFTLYALNSRCTQPLITVNHQSQNIEFSQINPVTYSVKLANLASPVMLEQLLHYDQNWQILSAIDRGPVLAVNSTHINNGSGFNSWIIDPKQIMSRSSSLIYSLNNNGSLNLDLLLYYRNQNNFYYGTIISGLFFVLIILLWLLKKQNRP